MRKIVSFVLAIIMVIGTFVAPAHATQSAVRLTLKLDGELEPGKTVVAELWCDENPGFCALQLTLKYNQAALNCTGCEVGPVLQDTLYVTDHAGEDGVVLAGISVSTVKKTGLVAKVAFRVQEESKPGFSLTDIVLAGETGEDLPYEFVILETPGAPEKPEVPEQPQTTPPVVPDSAEIEDDTGDVGESEEMTSVPSQTPDIPEQPTESETEEVKPAFTDIEGHWAEEYLVIAKERGLVVGYPDGRCGPDDQVTRAQFVMILWKNAGWPEPEKKSDFVDLEPGEYYLDAVAWAQEKGYVAGKGEGRFAPNDPVSREEIAVILRKLPASKTGMEQMFSGMYDDHFADSEKTSSWGRNAVYWAVYNEVWCGKTDIKMGKELKATDHASRAEVAVMMVNYQDNVEGYDR